MLPKIYKKVSETNKNEFLESVEPIKSKIRQWKLELVNHLCAKFLYHVGFVNAPYCFNLFFDIYIRVTHCNNRFRYFNVWLTLIGL